MICLMTYFPLIILEKTHWSFNCMNKEGYFKKTPSKLINRIEMHKRKLLNLIHFFYCNFIDKLYFSV